MRKTIIKIGIYTLGGLFSAILVFCSIYLFNNYPRPAEAFTKGGVDSTQKILIATQGSDFKDQFVMKLSEKLNSPDTYIEGIEVSDLKNEDPEQWDKIIIINSFIVKLNRKVDRFINRLDNPDKIILFVTAGGNDWVPKPELKVDALTSSSRLEYSDDLISLLTDWVNCPSGDKWEPNDYIAALRFYTQVNIEAACEKIYSDKQKYEQIHPKLESSINAMGYYFMRIGLPQHAEKVFRLNTDLYPDKANVYDSYAEALYSNGNISSAIKNYEKALEIDPDSRTAKEMLSKIKKTM